MRDGHSACRHVILLRHTRHPIFCASRVWDEHLEHGALLRKTEDAFQNESDAIVKRRTVTNHGVVTAYVSLWQIRAQLQERPPQDVTLRGPESANLTKDEEEVIEKKRGAFVRDGVIPSRFTAYLDAVRSHDLNMTHLATVCWGVLHCGKRPGFLCPGAPNDELYVPLSPEIALCAGTDDREVGPASVAKLNAALLLREKRLLFGHSDDVKAFLTRLSLTP